MARATETGRDSTAEVVGILNNHRAPSTASPSKRKRTDQAAPRLVGRPPKREKVADDAPAAVGAPSTVGKASVEVSGAQKGTKLRNPKDARRSRPSTIRMERPADVFAPPTSPESPSSATEQCSSGEDNEFNLEHNAFNAVPSSKEDNVDVVNSPSQNTRSQAKRANVTEHASPRTARSAIRNVRNLRPRTVISDSTGDISLEATYESELPVRTSKMPLQRDLKSLSRAPGASKIDSADLGYPSPAKTSRNRSNRADGAGRSTAATVPESRATKKNQRTPDTGAGRHGRDNSSQSEVEERERQREVEEEKKDDDDYEEQENGSENLREDGEAQAHNVDQEATNSERNDGRKMVTITSAQDSEFPRRKGRFETAAELFDCAQYWKTAWNAAKQNRDRCDPRSRPVQELAEAIKDFKEELRGTPNMTVEREAGSISELEESKLEKIAILIGNLRKTDSQTGSSEKRLMRDIYQQAIPRGVELLRLILVVRSWSGTLEISALEELIMVLKAVRRLCERIYHWKPAIHFEEPIKSRTNMEIKLSLKPIEAEYQVALTDLRNAQRQEESAMREKVFQERQARLKEAERCRVLERRQQMAEWAEKAQRRDRAQSLQQRREKNASPRADHEVVDVDDFDSYESTPQPTTGYAYEATDGIQGPPKRIWRQEETIALLLLLQRHRDFDRYERIQEAISEIARDVRKLGSTKLLSMTDGEGFDFDLHNARDVLDDLGNMEVADIQHQAQYLKAAQAPKMEQDIRATGDSEKWRWLSSV
jgi:hypothetical protein